MLDFIVERKRVDDLWSSIKDNRYKQQKLRLQVFTSSYVSSSMCFFMAQKLVFLFIPFVRINVAALLEGCSNM